MNKSIFIVIFAIISCKKNSTTELNNTAEIVVAHKNEITLDLFKCEFETYIVYKDSVPIYSEPNGAIFRYFRFEDDPEYDFGGGFLFKNSKNGWLQIGKDEFYPEYENYWIQSKYIQIGTNNYADDKIPLYKEPNKMSNEIGVIEKESYINVLDCENKWAFVKVGEVTGWVAPEYICTNPQTNCN
ncbi:MAG: hypothetical protein ABF274_11090 [Nonlabens sp.]|uniref:SH3 domain-containing protein n=1 Tax=Nonlabens sp. TaxID=1888209 RepID=UPI00321C17E6